MSYYGVGCLALSLTLFPGCAVGPGGSLVGEYGKLNLLSGDLIFLDLDCGELCQAMTQVTKEQLKVSGPNLSHVGMVEFQDGGEVMILEAWPAGTAGGVIRTPLTEVLSRVKGSRDQEHGFWLGRLQSRYRALGERAMRAARDLIGRSYDHRFYPDNDRYYCSELIYEAFKRANHGQPVFPLWPMYFGAPGTSAHQVWQKYYQQQGLSVPEGEPGLSPLGVYLYGGAHLFQSTP